MIMEHTFSIPLAPTDDKGQLIQMHVASHHVGNGEQTLCGTYIDYKTYKGNIDDAPLCVECDERDG